MNSVKKSISKAGQTTVLILVAFVLTGIIAWVDYKNSPSIAIGSLYSLVILYSWLLPHRMSSVWVASICSFLVIAVPNETISETEEIPLSGVNYLIALVSIWICATLVTIAKRSFNELEINISNKESQIELQTHKLQELNDTLEQQVYERTYELKAKNKELQEFAYVASHDLQEPLNTVNNFIELLTDEYKDQLNDEAQEYLSYISESSARLRSLIQDLLEHSRIGREKEYTLVNCEQLIDEVLKDLKETLDKSKSQINVGQLPVVSGIKVDLRLLFQNLISNAIKFRSLDRPSKIEIKAEANNGYYLFSVQDNGIGIPEKKQQKIFTIFKRLHSQDKYEGNGIGLAHCRKIVESYGGKIWVESEKNVGSNFQFTLPKS